MRPVRNLRFWIRKILTPQRTARIDHRIDVYQLTQGR